MPLSEIYNMYLDGRAFLATGDERPNMYIAEQFIKLKRYHHIKRRLKIIVFASLSKHRGISDIHISYSM